MTAYADSMNQTLVGGNPQATNQPTNEGDKAWDMGSDMLVVLTPADQTAIGDPAPTGHVIGQFVPVDDDHGIVHWADEYSPVRLRAKLSVAEERLGKCLDMIGHLMMTARWDAEVMAALLVGDEDAVDAAILKMYHWLSGTPCGLCDTGSMPGEPPMEHLAWAAKRLEFSAALKLIIAEDTNDTEVTD